MNEITFRSTGTDCAAWHLPAATDTLASGTGRPCVVMAHGFGGTRDAGLLGFAEAFAAAGIDALVFDYRGFGASGGASRQDVSFRRQRADYHAPIAAARGLPGVDPERIALRGTSYSGGHVIAMAAQDPRIAAAVAMTPATDGRAALVQLVRHAGPAPLLRTIAHGLRDVACAVSGRAPHHVPVVGLPGSVAMITAPGAEEAYVSMAGPSWRNEVCARTALEVPLNRPTTLASRIACPLLVQVGTRDAVAPPDAARRTAEKAGSRAQLLEYPVDHFDVYRGDWHKRVVADELEFLLRILAPAKAEFADPCDGVGLASSAS